MSGEFIHLRTPEGEAIVHMLGGLSDYATPCGLALDGDEFSGVVLPLPERPKISCPMCGQLFKIISQHRKSDFTRKALTS